MNSNSTHSPRSLWLLNLSQYFITKPPYTVVIPSKVGAKATAQGGICCFVPPKTPPKKQKARPIGRALFEIFTLYI
jgi:hypothetical protein